MTDEKQMAEMQNARLAQVLLNHFSEHLESRRKITIQRLKESFRSGKSDLVTLSSHLAVLCSLDDIELDLQRKINKGNPPSIGKGDPEHVSNQR